MSRRANRLINKRPGLKGSLICLIFVFLTSSCAFAYFEDYPPYKFKDEPPPHIKAELLVDLDKSQFTSRDGLVEAQLKDTASESIILLKEGTRAIWSGRINKQDDVGAMPHAVYRYDVDGNGLADFIIFSSYRGSGLAATIDKVIILLKAKDGSYKTISYETMQSDIGDFLNTDKDGKCEIVITDLFISGKHSYIYYNIYEIENFRLMNVDLKVKGFPKCIWYTFKPNDKETTHLTPEERAKWTIRNNQFIKYGEIK